MKRRLGELIAKKSKEKQIFIVTHDTDLIDGIVNTEIPFDVIKIKRDHQLDYIKFQSKKISNIHSEKKIPESLKVGFYDCAIFVEGVEDRYVYENGLKRKKILDDTSYAVVPCNGLDRISDQIKFSLELDLPMVVIVDFDALFSPRALNNILGVFKKYDSYKKLLPLIAQTEINLEDIRQNIKGIKNKSRGLTGDTKRYGTDLLKVITQTMRDLETLNVFVVPVGEMKDWTGGSGKRSAEDVLRRYISKSNTTYKGLTEFLSKIGVHLSNQP